MYVHIDMGIIHICSPHHCIYTHIHIVYTIYICAPYTCVYIYIVHISVFIDMVHINVCICTYILYTHIIHTHFQKY